jgi:HEPN domain-containing protein
MDRSDFTLILELSPMDIVKRKTVEGWVQKGANYLIDAREKAKYPYFYSESVQAAQQCVELSVKAVLALLHVEYKQSHGWNRDQLDQIASQVRDHELLERLAASNLSYTVRLPRLLFLANFWAQFYIQSKYGMEAGYLASARDLFELAEAEAAIKHAEECHLAAQELIHLDAERLARIVPQPQAP